MPTYINGTLQTSSQGADAQLDTLAALTAAQVGGLVDIATLEAPASDGQFIVATGSGVFAYESGATALTSIGGAPAAGSTSLTTTGNITAGSGSGDATVKSSGNHNLILQTGNSTTGNITLTDGANGDITISPNGSGAAKVGSAIVRTAGTEDMWIPAAAMRPSSSNGCAGIAEVETTSGRPDLQVLDFDKDSDEFAQFSVAFPKSWNIGNVTFQAYWTSSATNTGTVAWAMSGTCIGDNDTIDETYPTPTVATAKAHSGTVEDLNISAVSGAMAIENAADGELTFFQIFRDVSADDHTSDARLIGVKINYTTSAATDA